VAKANATLDGVVPNGRAERIAMVRAEPTALARGERPPGATVEEVREVKGSSVAPCHGGGSVIRH